MERGISDKYRCRRYCELSAYEIASITHAAVIMHRFYRDIADDFSISVGMVSRLAQKARAGNIVQDLTKNETKADDKRKIRLSCARLLERYGVIMNVAQVRN